MDMAVRIALHLLTFVSVCTALNWKFEYNGYQYYITDSNSNPKKNWYDARAECMAEGGDLATIQTNDESTWISNQVTSYSMNLWIGLNDLDNDGTWEWADFKTSSVNHWLSSEPRVNERCAYRTSRVTRTWYSENCGQEKGFMCKRELGVVTPKTTEATKPAGGFCPSGWIDSGTDRCYKAFGPVPKPIKWSAAQELCKKFNYYGSDLACASTQEEVSILTIMGAQRPKAQSLWIGLYRAYYNQQNWKWSDNTVVGITNFHESFYTNDYGCGFTSSSLTPSGTWDVDGTCTYTKNAYICQILKDPNNIISTPGPTAPNLCKAGYIPFENSCYKLINEKKSFSEAVKYCSMESATVVDIHSAAENSFVQLVTKASPRVWIGLTYNPSDHQYEWNNGWYVNYVRWGPNAPNPSKGDGCVYMQGMDSLWFDGTCSEKLPTICKTTTDPPFTPPPRIEGRCPNDWVPFGGHCYLFYPTLNKNWLESRIECGRRFLGAQQVSIHDEATNIEVFERIKDISSYGDSWLGLHISAITRQWVWQDGTQVQYTKWAPNEPSNDPSSGKDCAYMEISGTNGGLWVSSTCTYTRGLLCQIDKIPHLTTPVPVLGNCPSKEWTKYGVHCFLFRPDGFETWENAKTICETEGGKGSSLPRIDSWVENDYIHYTMSSISHLPESRNYWIGLSKEDEDKPYKWADGEELNAFIHWGASQPSSTAEKHCVQTNIKTTMWHNEKCNEITGYTCKVRILHEESGAVMYQSNMFLIAGISFVITWLFL